MGILKKDVNMVFFVLIIVTVVSFAGFTAYYQASFKNISSEYDEKIAELNQVTKDLTEKKNFLTQTNIDFNSSQRAREKLSKEFNDIKEIKGNLEEENSLMRDDLRETKNTLAKTISEANVAQAQVAAQLIKLTNLEQDVEYWKKQLKVCRNETD